MSDRMSCTPNPATSGETVTICYETLHATFPINLTISWSEDLGQTDLQINSTDLPSGTTVICFPVEVPANCEGGWVVDSTKQSNDLAITVLA
jgi:hypothetical protein